MTIFDQIQQLIIQFTTGEIKLAAFRQTFVPLYIGLDRSSDTEAVTLADRIESLYADLLYGDLDEKQFTIKLSSVRPMIVILADPEAAFGSTTGSNFTSINGNPRSTSFDPYTTTPQYAECT